MDDLEQKLRGLSLRAPSDDLDRRVAQALASQSLASAPRQGRRAVPYRWALAAALLLGVLGFLAGRLTGPGGRTVLTASDRTSATPAVTVHVVYEGEGANPFDCTVAADDGLRPVTDIKFTDNNGV